MQMPVDIPAVMRAATDIEAAAKTPLSVSVLIDEAAPGDCVGHVRAAFASTGARTRVTIGYLDAEPVVAHEGDDFAVIVAGTSSFIGAQAARLRAAGMPVMVATTLPLLVCEIAQAQGEPIPTGDVCAPGDGAASGVVAQVVGRARGSLGGHRTASQQAARQQAMLRLSADGRAEDTTETALPDAVEPILLTDEAAASLNLRMGQWICAALPDKKLACALAFPFVRRPLALDAVNATSMQNGAVGLVPIIPGADMPIMTLNQMKMLLQIAAAYGQPLNAERLKELAFVLGGAFALRNVARTVAGVVPVVGWAVRGTVGFAGTEAMGRAAIEYFEAGGDLVGLASVVQTGSSAAAKAAQTAAATPVGSVVVDTAKSAVGKAFSIMRDSSKKANR